MRFQSHLKSNFPEPESWKVTFDLCLGFSHCLFCWCFVPALSIHHAILGRRDTRKTQPFEKSYFWDGDEMPFPLQKLLLRWNWNAIPIRKGTFQIEMKCHSHYTSYFSNRNEMPLPLEKLLFKWKWNAIPIRKVTFQMEIKCDFH